MKKFLKILMIIIVVLVVLAATAMMLLPTILNEAMGGTAELDAPHVYHKVEALVARIEERDTERVLRCGEEIGLGSRTYCLINIEED